jgi:hypothetical protein
MLCGAVDFRDPHRFAAFEPGHADLGSAAGFAKRHAVLDRRTTLGTRMFHGSSRYSSAESRGKEGAT